MKHQHVLGHKRRPGAWLMTLLLLPASSVSAEILPFADSVITVQFATEVTPAIVGVFGSDHRGLQDDYEPWPLGRGFYVFGVDENSDVDSVMEVLRSSAAVRIVNPVLATARGNIWMTIEE
jgi:hypothetical protein